MLGKDLIISSDYCKWRVSLLSVEIKAGLLTVVESLDRVGRVTPLSTSNNDESSGTSGHKNCKGILRQNRESMRVYYNYNPSSQQEFMWFEIVFWDIEHIHAVNYRILTPAAKDTITGESQEV